MSSVDDLKTLRNYALGVAGFGTTISAILIQAFHFPPEPTLLCVLGFAVLMLLMVFLIGKSEKRQQELLASHIKETDASRLDLDNRLDKIDEVLFEIQKSTTRLELLNMINESPENHDTIIRIAEHYFTKLDGNWYARAELLQWAKAEGIELPESLLNVK